MEIEAKFILSDVLKFQSLQALNKIGDFTLSAHQIQQVHDTYLDTKERLILASGYSCRLRKTETDVLITVKGLEKANGAIHRRKELEVSLPVYDIPQNWVKSPARNLVLQLIGDKELIPLFDFQQTRVYRYIKEGQKKIAQLSLDNVHIVAGNRKQRHFELEVELRSEGTQKALEEIVSVLQNEWKLKPEKQSKFERSLRFMNEVLPEGALLTPQENAICTQIAKRDDVYALRAQGLLMLDKGSTQIEVAENTQRTIGTVRRWQRNFNKKRLGDFPKHILTETLPASAVILPETASKKHPSNKRKNERKTQPQTETLQKLLERYLVDQNHANAVAENALTLFDTLDEFHNLTSVRRPLLEKAARLHNIGLVSGAKKYDKKGRDILLKNPPQGLSAEEQLIISLTTYLNQKEMTYKVLEKRKSKKTFSKLSDKAKNEALALSALIRLANGLDYSQSQSSEIEQATKENGRVLLKISGPHATQDATSAQKKSDLWHLLFKTKLHFTSDEMIKKTTLKKKLSKNKESVLFPPKELPSSANIKADDSVSEAARKIFAYQFQRILYFEEGIRKNNDIENLHKMRVSTRRIRATFRVFDDHINSQELKSFRKGMQRTGRKLGTMRDLDVFWEKTQCYLKTFPEERQNELSALQEVWEEEHRKAREGLMLYLDSDYYTHLKESFAKSLQKDTCWHKRKTTKQDETKSYRVRHLLPAIIYKEMADILAYDEWITNPSVSLNELHQLRIAGKKLRYTLEAFEEVLSPQTETAILEIRKLQDHLGDLQDAVLASEYLRNFLTWGKWGKPKEKKNTLPQEPILAPGVATYLADRQGELYRHLRTFPEVWVYFQSNEFKKLMAEVITTL